MIKEVSQNRRGDRATVPLVDGLLILLVRFDEPLADANEAAVHEAALQQVVDGFEQKGAAFVGKAVLPQTIILSWKKRRQKQVRGEDRCSEVCPKKHMRTL